MKNIWAFDVLKFTLAVVIVSLHAGVSEAFVVPISKFVRNFQDLAVPCFFLVSSVLFFGKVFQEQNTQYQWKLLWHYEKRLLLLYAIWQLVLLPVTLLTHDYLQQGFSGVLCYLKDMLFAYTFPASWFFGALIVAMPLVFVVRNYPYCQMIIALLLYICFMTESNLPETIQMPFEMYRTVLAAPRLSFPEGFLWLSIGCFMAKKELTISLYDRLKGLELTSWGGVVLLLLMIMALAIYFRWCQMAGVIALFYLAGCFDFSDNYSRLYARFRKYSTLYYCMHYTVIHIIWQVVPSDKQIVIWLIAVIICTVLGEMIIRLSERRRFTFLKYIM